MSIFDRITPSRFIRQNKFNLSHEKKLSHKMGALYPVLLQEALPGDKWKGKAEIDSRLAPMIAPIKHRVNIYMHYFFVPNRIIWDDFETFLTGGKDGLQTATVPFLRMDDSRKQYFAKGSLADYMGLPSMPATTVQSSVQINALPFRAYQKIFNEYYTDPTVGTESTFTTGSGDASTEVTELTKLRNRSWEKDYFTSALPWLQRGEQVQTPLTYDPTGSTIMKDSNGDPQGTPGQNVEGGGSGQMSLNAGPIVNIDNTDNLGFTIDQLRTTARLQEYLEANARGGWRYVEQLLHRWGVVSPDARLQRPEYIGGGRTPIMISEVNSTIGEQTPTTYTAQGTPAGHGQALGANASWSKTCKEHGWIMGIMSVLPKTAYQQGVPRHFGERFNREDWFNPEFAQLSEQAIKNQEVYMGFTDVSFPKTETFGYQHKYAEYKYACDQVHGDFRESLNFWHMGRIFDSLPVLNSSFTEADPTDRIWAVQDGTDQLWTQIYHNISAIRKMPYFHSPKL